MLMPEGEQTKKDVFASFKTKYAKEYADRKEEDERMAIFHHNMRYIHAMNRKVRSDVIC